MLAIFYLPTESGIWCFNQTPDVSYEERDCNEKELPQNSEYPQRQTCWNCISLGTALLPLQHYFLQTPVSYMMLKLLTIYKFALLD